MSDSDGRIVIEVVTDIDPALEDLRNLCREMAVTQKEAEALIAALSKAGESLAGLGNKALAQELEGLTGGFFSIAEGVKAAYEVLSQLSSLQESIAGNGSPDINLNMDSALKTVSAIHEEFKGIKSAAAETLNAAVRGFYDKSIQMLDDMVLAFKEAEQEEIILLGAYSNEKIGILSQAHLDRLKMIDEETAAVVSGINEEIAALIKYESEISRLGLKTGESSTLEAVSVTPHSFEDAKRTAREYLDELAHLQEEQDRLIENAVENYLALGVNKAESMVRWAVELTPLAIEEVLVQWEEGLQDTEALLDRHAPGWQERGRSFVEYFQEGMYEAGEVLIDGMKRIGEDAMAGLLQAIRDARPGITDELEELAQAILAALRSSEALDTHSPSKKTYKVGVDTGAGLVLGTVDAIKSMMPEITAAAAGIPAAVSSAGISLGLNAAPVVNNSSSHTSVYYNTEVPINLENVDMRGENNIEVVSENLAFMARRAFAGKGGRNLG